MRSFARYGALVCSLLVSSWAGCGSPIVSAECDDGYTLCDGACVDLDSDFRHCGGCGNDCGLFVCDEGMCSASVVRPDASLPDGAVVIDGALVDARVPDDADVIDGGMSEPDASFPVDAGLSGCRLGERECGGMCVNPRTDPDHCGACDNACSGGDVCSGGTCAPACVAPLTACSGRCIDAETDPRNCGRCGKVCSSGICEDGECADRVAGHAVVFGHDFTQSNKVMRRLAGNAVFLGRGAPVRVLVYRGEATSASIKGVEASLALVKSEIGRDFVETDAIEAVVPLQLAEADVFLIHAQAQARTSTLEKLGQQWGNALAQFVAGGGVIVLFDAPSARNDGTFRVLEPAQIFVAGGREPISGQQLQVVAPGVGVTARVPSRYASATSTVRFMDVVTSGTAIVVDRDDEAVVEHRIIRP